MRFSIEFDVVPPVVSVFLKPYANISIRLENAERRLLRRLVWVLHAVIFAECARVLRRPGRNHSRLAVHRLFVRTVNSWRSMDVYHVTKTRDRCTGGAQDESE